MYSKKESFVVSIIVAIPIPIIVIVVPIIVIIVPVIVIVIPIVSIVSVGFHTKHITRVNVTIKTIQPLKSKMNS